jgi:alpha-galactosidase
MYVKEDKSKAIVFNYLVNNEAMNTNTANIKLDGLDAGKQYSVREINLYPGTNSRMSAGQIYSGDSLMKVGVEPNLNQRRQSVVLEVTEVED